MSPAWVTVLIVLGVVVSGLLGAILTWLVRRLPPDREPQGRHPFDDGWGSSL